MILLSLFLILNSIALVLIGYDKNLAKNHKRRISEKLLLTSLFFGGSIGSGLGMLFFRHKMAKKSYLLKYWVIVLIQIVLVFGLYYFGFL